MNKRAELWVVFGAGAVVAGLGAWLYAWLISTLSYSFEAWRIIAADLLPNVVIPAAGGFVALAWRRRARRSGGEPRAALRSGRLGQWVAAIVLAAYGVTWAFGVPSVITSLTGQEIQEYKQAAAYRQGPRPDPYPWIRTLVAFPLLPGLLVVYRESQIAPPERLGRLGLLRLVGNGLAAAVSLRPMTQVSRSTAALIPSSTASRSDSGSAPIH